jgi:hypothetical protein
MWRRTQRDVTPTLDSKPHRETKRDVAEEPRERPVYWHTLRERRVSSRYFRLPLHAEVARQRNGHDPATPPRYDRRTNR